MNISQEIHMAVHQLNTNLGTTVKVHQTDPARGIPFVSITGVPVQCKAVIGQVLKNAVSTRGGDMYGTIDRVMSYHDYTTVPGEMTFVWSL